MAVGAVLLKSRFARCPHGSETQKSVSRLASARALGRDKSQMLLSFRVLTLSRKTGSLCSPARPGAPARLGSHPPCAYRETPPCPDCPQVSPGLKQVTSNPVAQSYSLEVRAWLGVRWATTKVSAGLCSLLEALGEDPIATSSPASRTCSRLSTCSPFRLQRPQHRTSYPSSSPENTLGEGAH